MACSQCQSGGVNVFGKRRAERQLRRYHQRGPDRTTQLLLDALAAEGVAGLSLLDIGGGIRAIALELLKTGVTAATEVEASPTYVTLAKAEAARAGVTDRIAFWDGDFVALAADLPAAGIVTLDRVICCYADMPVLVGPSASKAVRLYGVVYPRDTWWVHAARVLANLALRLLREPAAPLHPPHHGGGRPDPQPGPRAPLPPRRGLLAGGGLWAARLRASVGPHEAQRLDLLPLRDSRSRGLRDLPRRGERGVDPGCRAGLSHAPVAILCAWARR